MLNKFRMLWNTIRVVAKLIFTEKDIAYIDISYMTKKALVAEAAREEAEFVEEFLRQAGQSLKKNNSKSSN